MEAADIPTEPTSMEAPIYFQCMEVEGSGWVWKLVEARGSKYSSSEAYYYGGA